MVVMVVMVMVVMMVVVVMVMSESPELYSHAGSVLYEVLPGSQDMARVCKL